MLKKATLMILGLTFMVQAQTPEEAVRFMENQDGVGVKAMALGNAFTAVADDYSAIYWNPAGLASISRSELAGDLSYFNFNNEATFAGITQIDKQEFTKLKSLGLAYKVPTARGSLVFGFGYHRIKDYENLLQFNGINTNSNGLSFELQDNSGIYQWYDFDRNARQEEEILETGNLNSLTFGAGVAMSPNFNLGASIHLLSGKSQYAFDFYQHDIDNTYALYPADFNSYELHQDILSKLSGVHIKIGALFHLNQEFCMGASVELPTALRIRETWSENDALIFDDGYISEMDLGVNEWEYAVRYPMQFSGGMALNFKQLLLAASCQYRDWTQTRFEAPEGHYPSSDYTDLLAENNQFSERFRPVLSWSIGGEYRIPGSGIKLRGGYRVVPSPLSDAEKSLNKRYISGGAGFDLDKTSSIHLTYIKGVWNQESVDGYTPGGTQENIRTDRVIAGITLRLD